MTEKLKLSYSKLSEFDRRGARSLVDRVREETNATTTGSLINDLLFQQVDMDKKYFIKNYNNPTSTSLKLANIIIDNYVDIPDDEEIINIIRKNEFWNSTKKVEKLKEYYNKPEFWEYLELNMKGSSKLTVTPDVKLLADEVVYVLKTHKHSRNFFNGRYEVIPEVPFEIPYNDVILRGIVDMIVVDREHKTFRIVDLKTGAKEFAQFNKSILEWRYYLQEAVYMLAADTLKEQLGVSDFETLPFQFLYIGLSEKVPVIYEVNEKWHNAGLNGFMTKSGYLYKGLNELIDDIKFHHHYKLFDLSRELIQGEGVVQLNDIFYEKE